MFLSLCTGAFTVQNLEYLISEVYRLPQEEASELVKIYLKKSSPYIDLLPESYPYESFRYDPEIFLQKSTDSSYKYNSRPTPNPLGININLSFQCNFNCRYCYQTQSNYGAEKLDLDKCLMLIREAAELGVAYAGLTGGEPTLFNGWTILLEEILRLGMIPLFTTNGVVIGDSLDIADHLKAIGLKEITVSLDASNPELHHYITRSHNTYSKVINAISYLVNSGITVSVKCVLVQENIEDIENLIDLLVNLGVSEISITSCESGACGSDANKIPQINSDKIAIVREKIKAKNKQYSGTCKIYAPRDTSCMLDENGWYPCGGLYFGMSIFPSGKVSICNKLREDTQYIYGDVYNKSLKEIWESEDFRQLRERTEDFSIIDTECSKCSKLKMCRTGCFVDSKQFKGDYYAKFPRCSGPF
jgi:radical SAM protein with 4Fe4S-binding SPASM domain